MRRFVLVLSVWALSVGAYTASVVLPVFQASLNYTDRSAQFSDAPFPQEESVAISLLTNLGAVAGYPDGSFLPGRKLNRAEFLKVALMSHPLSDNVTLVPMGCFPDVRAEDWYSPYVCSAKERGIITGYADGLFRPAQPVSFAEAITILVRLYRHPQTSSPGDAWYVSFVRAAHDHDLLLQPSVPYDALLTRGQMARLAAAFRAEVEGELEHYYILEGRATMEEEAPIPEDEETPENEGGSSSSSASSVGETEVPFISATSHLLLLGSMTPLVADGLFVFGHEEATVRIVNVRLDRTVESIESVILVDADGQEAGPLRPQTIDNKREWKGEFDGDKAARIPADRGVRLGLKVKLWGRGNRGESEELFQVREFDVVAQGTGGQMRQLLAQDRHFPFHQTVQASVASVWNGGDTTGVLRTGKNRLLGSFAFSAKTLPETDAAIENLVFTLRLDGVRISNWALQRPGMIDRVPCFVSTLEEDTIDCVNIPRSVGLIGSNLLMLNVYGDIVLETSERHSLQLILGDPGAIGRSGAVQWTDQTGHFVWMEGEYPLAEGTKWEVE